LQAVLNLTDKAATKRGDAYIASELFLLALVQQNDATGKILKEAGATEQNINAAIDAVRGGQNVNDANAEDQRDALKKGIKLCEEAQDYVTRDLMVAQLKDTEEDHAHWLEQQLRLIELVGEGNYYQSQL